MIKLFFLLMALVILFIARQEFKIYRMSEEERLKKRKELLKVKEDLSDELLREDTLDVEAEVVVRRVQNDDFKQQINELRKSKEQ